MRDKYYKWIFLIVRLTGEIQKITEAITQHNTSYNKLKDAVKDKDKNVRMIDDNIALKIYEEESESLARDLEKFAKAHKEWVENDSKLFINP